MRWLSLVAMSLVLCAPLARSWTPADEPPLPKFGEYVYIEELPEAVTRVEPRYPDIAREAGVDGVVLVQVLVDRQGDVADTRVVKSVPMLDQAAVECVRRWHFKPALSNNKPVAMWIAIPVRFKLDRPVERESVHLREPAAPEPRPQPDMGAQLSAGRYFINGDSTSLVLVTEFDGHSVRLESPGEWRGAGVVSGSTYWGVFVYRGDAREPKNRGARGTHLGTLEPSGQWRIRGAFTNRPWPEFQSTWSPGDPVPGTPGHGGRRDGVAVPDPARELDPRTTLEHPVWPPGRDRDPGPQFEHPVWPRQWWQGDRRIVLADHVRVDVMPVVTRHVEPEYPDDMRAGDDALVVVRARIGRDGTVSDTQIARSEPMLDAAALEAVSQWRFRPARYMGRPVAVAVYVPVRFAGR